MSRCIICLVKKGKQEELRSELPKMSDEEQRDCIRQMAEEAMVSVPAYLAELRAN